MIQELDESFSPSTKLFLYNEKPVLSDDKYRRY